MSWILRSMICVALLMVAGTGTPAAQTRDGAVAAVGRLPVPEAEFSKRVDSAVRGYEQRTGQPVPEAFEPMLRRHVLEGLIRTNLLMLEAERRGLLATDAEAEEALKQNPYFNEGGRFDEGRFEAVRVTNPEAFRSAIEETRLQLSGQRLSQQLEREYSPDAAVLRREIERELTSVNMHALLLPYSEFSGLYREPSEKDILDYYRSNPQLFVRPARATITALGIEAPALVDSLQEDPRQVRAREQRLRQRADSALAAAQSGTSLDALAGYGRVYGRVEVRRDNFPGFWRGNDRDQAAVFARSAGGILESPVRGRDGWLVVRVDEASGDEPAPLIDVAPQIRDFLRARNREEADDRVLRDIYQQLGDSLMSPAARVRYATFRADDIESKEPSEGELKRYYRAHLADYATFDAARGELIEQPFSEVRDDVARQLVEDGKRLEARARGEKIFETWSKGRRDSKGEASGSVVEIGPVPIGASIGRSGIERALSDTLRARGGAEGVGWITIPDGMVVFHFYEYVPDFRPTFEEARHILGPRLLLQRQQELDREARELYDANPEAFAVGEVIHFSRLIVPRQEILTVPLTRQEVEKWHRENLQKYSAPEVVSARHILISPAGPGPGPDQAARIKAEGILRRVRAGEAFEDLAREFSDDLATRDDGGSLGSFGRGIMGAAFDKAVFAMRAGDVSELVRSPAGYHIIKCTAYEPMVAPPLPSVYSNVSGDAAREKSIELTRLRADSIFREIDTIEEAIAISQNTDIGLVRNQRVRNTSVLIGDMGEYFRILETLEPGEFYPGVHELRGQGYVITWVDSISPRRAPRWDEVRTRVVDELTRRRSSIALSEKLDELRRLEAQGWSLDSLAALFGGLARFEEARVGDGLPGMGGVGVLDSLMFGTESSPAMQDGSVTDWVEFPGGFARIRLDSRLSPPADQLASRVAREQRREVERELYGYFEGLKKRHAVQIFDEDLRLLTLSPPPPR